MSESTFDREATFTLARELAFHVGKRMVAAATQVEEISMEFKSGEKDIVTEVDVWGEKEIISRVSKEFPDHMVLGEETSEELVRAKGKSFAELASHGICWIVDPVDGTTNFSNRNPQTAVSIAVLVDGVRTIGIIYDPFRDEIFSAIHGEGALLNGAPISVGQKTKVKDAVIATGFPYDREKEWPKYLAMMKRLMTASRAPRVFGAAVIDQAWVACGRFDAFCEYSLKPWDVAAGSLIVEEAGGVSKNFLESSSESFSCFHPPFLFCNEGIAEELTSLLVIASEERLEVTTT